MDPVTMGLIAMGVGGAVKLAGDLFDDTSSKQANLMREQARLKMGALEETMRRREGEQTQVLSSTKARMAATGFSSDSLSFTNYLTGMADEFKKQDEYASKSGLASIALMDKAADILDDPMKKILGGISDVFGIGSSMAGLMAKS